MLERSQKTVLFVGSASCLAVAVAVSILIIRGAGNAGVDAALAATARLAFLFFWPCYVGGALVALFGPWFLPLKRLGREFGLSFAAVELVHLSLVARLCLIGETPSRSTFILFGTAAIFVYLIALISMNAIRRSINPNVSWAIRLIGMNFITYAFAVDFFRDPLSAGPKHVLAYLPFITLTLLGPALRLAAGAKYLDRILKSSPYRVG
jgi:hypothetical protein